jgi:NADH dehydrogenase
VILGGGFGGLYCARHLKRAGVRVTVIDRENFHLFQPLLYQVATASLSPADIASPIRAILRGRRDVEVWLAEATQIDVANKRVTLTDGSIAYDYLVVATGVTHAYFGQEQWASHAPGLKTIDDATEIRRRFLLAFEAAEREADPDARRRLLTFVIVGGGPTGVELAGAMIEIARHALPKDFRSIDTTTARVLLIEGTDRVLPTYPADLSAKALKQLEELGVEVVLSKRVTSIEDGLVRLGDEVIEARNVFWAAGVAASPLGATIGAETDRAGRVVVEPDCSIRGHSEVFVIGDLAVMRQDGERLVPGVAQGAIQSGKHVAEMIRRDVRGRARKPFRYLDKGNIATIGRAAAVAEIFGLHISGFIAWLVWVFLHILYLIGFRNRILVMVQWTWAYIAYQRGIRLITGHHPFELSRAREAAASVAAPSRHTLFRRSK